MREFLILGFIAAICAAPTQWRFYQQGGTTKLLGTAFGLIGKDATYDYVVRVALLQDLAFADRQHTRSSEAE